MAAMAMREAGDADALNTELQRNINEKGRASN